MDGLHRLDAADFGALPSQAQQLAAALAGGMSVLLVSSEATSGCLRLAGHMLGVSRTRVVHVRPPLDLSNFIEQAAAAAPATGESALEQAFNGLTALDEECSCIVLMVEDAHLLPHPTLRYIEMALRAGPHLHVVLAGTLALEELLALPGFMSLRQRLTIRLKDREQHVQLDDGEQHVDVAVPRPALRHGRPALLAGALAASVAVWLVYPSFNAPPHPPALAEVRLVAPAPVAAAQTADAPGNTKPAEPVADVAGPALAVAEPPVAAATPPAELEKLAAAETAPEPSDAPDSAPSPPFPPVAQTELPELVVQPPVLARIAAPPRQAVRPPLPRPERVAAFAPMQPTAQNERRCRDIVLRAQLGEAPNNADQTFLRNGCR